MNMDEQRRNMLAGGLDRSKIDAGEYAWIERGGDVEDALYAETEAWHGRGRVYAEGGIPAAVAMKDPSIDWEVEKVRIPHPGHAYDPSIPEEEQYFIEDKWAIRRKSDNSILGVVGNKYTPIQNAKGFQYLSDLVDSGELLIEAVVSMRGGRTVAIEARRPESIYIASEEVVPYLLFANSHDGSGQATMMPTDERTVCRNTLRAAFRGAKTSYKIRHTANAEIKLEEARAALEISFKYTEVLSQTAEELLGLSFTHAEFERFVNGLVTVPPEETDSDGKVSNQRTITVRENLRESLIDTYVESENLNDIRGTGWGAWNSIVEHEQHVKSYRSQDTKMDAILSGRNTLVQPSLDRLLEMAKG